MSAYMSMLFAIVPEREPEMNTVTESVEYVKAEDGIEFCDKRHNGHALQMESLPGIWLNTNSETGGIVKIEIALRGSRLVVHAFGAGVPGPSDWGETEADNIFSNNISSHTAAGFTAHYDFDFSQVCLEANWNQGLLVLASFTRFKDGSNRSNYFSRDFFRR